MEVNLQAHKYNYFHVNNELNLVDIYLNNPGTINAIPLLSKDLQFKQQQAHIIESVEKYHKDHLRVTNSKFSLGNLFCEVCFYLLLNTNFYVNMF